MGEAEHMAVPLPGMRREGGEQLLHHPLRLHAEDHPVDGLELQGGVVEVDQLGVPGGQAVPLPGVSFFCRS